MLQDLLLWSLVVDTPESATEEVPNHGTHMGWTDFRGAGQWIKYLGRYPSESQEDPVLRRRLCFHTNG